MFDFGTLATLLFVSLVGGHVNCELGGGEFIQQQLGFYKLGVSGLLWNYLSENPLELTPVSDQCKFQLRQIASSNNSECE